MGYGDRIAEFYAFENCSLKVLDWSTAEIIEYLVKVEKGLIDNRLENPFHL
jgi:hypothetical protein